MRPRRRWSQHRTSCKRRSSAVPALTAPQGAVWRLGRCFACELTLTAIYTAPFTSGISVLSRVGAGSQCCRASEPGALLTEVQTGCWRVATCLRGEKASGESLPPDDDRCRTAERNSLERRLFGSSTSMQALQTGLWSKSGPLATRARNPWRGHLKNLLIRCFARGPEIVIHHEMWQTSCQSSA